MAQRLLSGFDALDKYSQDLLVKRAKKCHLSYMQRIPALSVPLSFDFEPETRQGSGGKLFERQRNSHLSSRKPSSDASAQSGIRPSTAALLCPVPDSDGEGRESMKRTKLRSVSARQRRPWSSEVECIPNIDTLCQEQSSGPICSILSIPYSHRRSSFLSPREPQHDSLSIDNSHQPPRQDDIRAGGTPTLSNKSKCGGDNSITEDKNPSREQIQKVAMVSLSIEDEMKKSDVRIITVRQKTEASRPGRLGDARPVTYGNCHNRFIVFNSSPSVQRKLTTNSHRSSGCQRSAGNTRGQTGTSSVPHNNMDYGKHAIKPIRPVLQTSNLMKSKANDGLLSDNVKVIIHFLSADGTKQKVDFATDSKVSNKEQVKCQSYGKTSLQEAKPTARSIPTGEMKDEPSHVGPIINGMNPKKAGDQEQSTHSRSHHASRSFCPGSPRAPRSHSPRLNSVGEIRKWRYISISKPLSSPESQLSSLQSNSSASITSEIMKVTVRPVSGMDCQHCTVPLRTRPLALESRNGRRGSVPAEVGTLGTDLGGQRTTGCTGEETEKGGCESVVGLDHVRSTSATPMVTEPPNTKSPKNDSNDRERTRSPIPAHLTAIPVISIPTAPIDVSE